MFVCLFVCLFSVGLDMVELDLIINVLIVSRKIGVENECIYYYYRQLLNKHCCVHNNSCFFCQARKGQFNCDTLHNIAAPVEGSNGQ